MQKCMINYNRLEYEIKWNLTTIVLNGGIPLYFLRDVCYSHTVIYSSDDSGDSRMQTRA